MKVLVVGKGGREHALGWKIKQSPLVEKVYFAPGNGGTSKIGENIDINVDDFEKLIKFVKENKIDFTVVGPEDPLVNGIVDAFERENLKIFGPRKNAAILEGSKAFAKDFMKKYSIPTAKYEKFINPIKAFDYIDYQSMPIVVKASGLAAGKGAIICNTKEEAKRAVKEIMIEKKFGEEAGKEIVIEEFMTGDEASIFIITDGENYKILPPSQDHKKIGEGDTGLNTGGMGAYTNPPIVTERVLKQVEEEIIIPTLKGMKNENRVYKGLLYIGLMIENEYAKVVEYNCRFGDPETQAVLFAMEEDIVPYLLGAIEGNLNELNDINIISNNIGSCVVIAAKGYPESYPKGMEIKIEPIEDNNIIVFHAETKKSEDGKLISNGGRVLNVVAKAENFDKAFDLVYSTIENKIYMDNMYYRRDIGYKVRTNK